MALMIATAPRHLQVPETAAPRTIQLPPPRQGPQPRQPPANSFCGPWGTISAENSSVSLLSAASNQQNAHRQLSAGRTGLVAEVARPGQSRPEDSRSLATSPTVFRGMNAFPDV